MTPFIVAWGVVVMLAALWTGAERGFVVGTMWGILPPHYGYSAYAMVPLLFLGPRWVRVAAGGALLLSGNRASWVGAIAGWVMSAPECDFKGCLCERWNRVALAVMLALVAVIGGNALKTYGSRGDSVRVQVWKAAAAQAVRRPGPFYVGIAGRATAHAHSDVLQVAATRGWKAAVLVVLLAGWAFYRLPDGPGKAVVAALMVVSIIDNRLHHPACVALFAAAWYVAWSNPRLQPS
jgi:hypothetical protein